MPSNISPSEQCQQRRGFLLAKKIGSIISIACGRRKITQQLCSDDAKKCTPQQEKAAAILEDNRRTFNRFPGSYYRKQSQKSVKRPIIKSVGFDLRRWRIVKTTRELGDQVGMRPGSNKRNNDGNAREGVVELCKKRILMGGRCRPLNRSGVLHYDEDGILLPEDLLTSEKA